MHRVSYFYQFPGSTGGGEDDPLRLGSFRGRSLQRRRLLGQHSDERAVELFRAPLNQASSSMPMSLFHSSDGSNHYDKEPRVKSLRVVRLRDQKVCTLIRREDNWYDEENFDPLEDSPPTVLINEFDVSADRVVEGEVEGEVQGDPYRIPSKMLEILFDVRWQTCRRESHLLVRKDEHPEGISEVASVLDFQVDILLRCRKRSYDPDYGEVHPIACMSQLGLFLSRLFS
mmetsp:Transcript_31892/g.63228  ORF Transcript_31892/g.63228 Transcript_31892/m.63228 type:complete len:229 (-) Transcript_31892:33-719(-)